MIIRRMREADLEMVVPIENACFSLPWSRQGFLDSLNGGDAIFLVAESDKPCPASASEKEIMGYVGMIVSVDEGEITNVAVAERFRGEGVGEALMRAIIGEAKESALKRIVLEVRVSNTPAIELYKKVGFTSLGIRKNFYEFPKEDAGIMVWEDLC